MAQSLIVLIPAKTNRAVPDTERMIGLAVHTSFASKGIHP
jgi:hypothetical protein